MSYSVKIDGNDLPNDVVVAHGSLKIDFSNEGKSTAKLDLIDKNPGGRPLFYFTSVFGEKVEIYENGSLIFGGMIKQPDTVFLNRKPVVSQKIDCDGWHVIPDRIYVNESYSKTVISDLFKTIVDDYLAVEGITYDGSSVQTTTEEISINCPYIYCSKVFDELCELIGYVWYIGPDKKIYFHDRTQRIGNSLTQNNQYLFDSLSISDDASEYRNKQVFRKVHAVTDELTEALTPSADQEKTYVSRFKLNSKPKIYVTQDRNNPSEHDLVDPTKIGINEISSGMYWYWSKNQNTITQDQEQPEIEDGYYVVMKYHGQYQTDVIDQDNTEIAARQAIEGGSGVYCDIQDGSGIEGLTIAEDKITSLLSKYSKVMKCITVSSYEKSWEIGQICDVVFPTLNINSLVASGYGYLVESLSIEDKGPNLPLLRKVTLIDGVIFGGWINFFKKWLAKEDEFVIREDELVITTEETEESIDWSGEVVMSKYDCLYPANNLYPADDLYPGTLDTTQTLND